MTWPEFFGALYETPYHLDTMSFLFGNQEADHLKTLNFLRGLKVYKLMASIGLGAPLHYPCYLQQRSDIRNVLQTGLTEVDGEDPLDRLLKGLESEGDHVITGSKVAANSPKFAATMLLALRAALGRLERNDVNVKLAESEYRRICRARNVRLTIIEQHRAITIDSYFNEGLFDEVVASKQRLPAWLRWLIGFYNPTDQAFAKYW